MNKCILTLQRIEFLSIQMFCFQVSYPLFSIPLDIMYWLSVIAALLSVTVKSVTELSF